MEALGQIFSTIFLHPINNILIAFYKLFLAIHLPWAFGFAIVALVVVIRLVLHPFFKQQLETTKKMQQIKPRLDKLSAKYKDNPKQMQIEQMNIYKEAGINPAAGCLFMLIQIPVFWALYHTLSTLLTQSGPKVVEEINKIVYFPFLKVQQIDPHFLMFNLALSPQKSGEWYYYLVPAVTGVLQFFQAKATMPQSTVAPKAAVDTSKNAPAPKKDSAADFQNAMSMQMKYILPVMIAYFSFTLPVGLSLYWNIFSIFSIMQYKMMHKKAGDEKLHEEAIEEHTSDTRKLEPKLKSKKGKK